MKPSFLILLFAFLAIIIQAQTIDESFNDPIPIRPAMIQSIKVIPDGKKVLGGDVDFYYGHPVNKIFRVNPDDTFDETFVFNGPGDMIIRKIELQSNGNFIVLAQEYNSAIDQPALNYRLFQLDSSGEIISQIDTLEFLLDVAVQSDDKVLVCGGRNGFNGYLYRYNNDFTEDTQFNSDVSFNNRVSCITIKADRLYIGGSFSVVNGIPKNDIVKIKLDGSIDNSFDTGTGTNDQIGSLTVQDDEKVLVGKTYISYFNNVRCYGLIRLNADGTLDDSFVTPAINGPVNHILIKGSNLYTAAPMLINSLLKTLLIRLNADGSMDDSFEPFVTDGIAFNFYMATENENIIINGSTRMGNIYGLTKLDQTGKVVESYKPETGRYGVITMGDYFNGKLIIAGDFIKINEIESFGLAKLYQDGSVDPLFSLSENHGKIIHIKVLAEDTLLVGTVSELFKLGPDAEFHPNFNFHFFKTLHQISKIKVLDNKKIIVGDANNIYRLNSNGSEDISFDIGTGIDGTKSTSFDFDIQNDKIIYGSAFSSFNGTPVKRMVRLHPDGSPDPDFNIGGGPDSTVTAIKVLDNGEIIVSGMFRSFDGSQIPFGVVKLSADGSLDHDFNNNQMMAYTDEPRFIASKIEEMDSTILIKGSKTVLALRTNGTIDSTFLLPLEIDQINDVIPFKDVSENSNNLKSTITSTQALFMFGTFRIDGKNSPSFIVRLELKTTTLQIEPPTADNVTVCEGISVPNLVASGNNIKWYSDPELINLIGSGNNFATGMTQAGVYKYYATQTLNEIQSNYVEVTLTINSVPTAPVVNNIVACEGSVIPDLSATGTDIKWYSDEELNLLVNNGVTFETSKSQPGEYVYYVTQTLNGCESMAVHTLLTIHSLPELYLGKDTTISNNGTLLLNAEGDFTNFLWYNGLTINSIELEGNKIGPGTHEIWLIATDNNNCSSKDTIKVTVALPSALDSNLKDNLVKIYPNPTEGLLNIVLLRNVFDNVRILVLSGDGSLVLKDERLSTKAYKIINMDISGLSDGVYFIQIIADDKTYGYYKVIKK